MSKEKAPPGKRVGYMFVKNLYDLFLPLVLVLVFLPVYIILAIAVKVDSPGPVFYCHKRLGKNGVPFKLLKFRTMVVDAEERMAQFTPEQKAEFQQNYKLEHDPRITRLGRFLRESSLDELPQFFNVIWGDMSLIGPRPVVEAELEKYGEHKDKFLSVLPGVSGFWQVNGRSDTTYEQRIEMELYYIDNATTWMDFHLMFGTIGAVVRKKGAR